MARWPLVLFVVALFAVLALPREARAGSLQIRDEAHVLAPEDAARLRSTVATARFDARLVFTNDYAEAGDLSLMVASLLTKPDTIAVGVDPRHRHVQVHFGTGSGIPRAAWPAIERAGNGAFRNGEWEAGAAAILGAAADATTGASEQAAPVAPRSPNFVGSGLFLLLGIAAIIGVTAFFFARRRSPYDASGGGYGPTPPLGAGGYGPAPYAGPGYPAPPVGGGMGPLGGGLIGAGLGGLAGYELGKLEGEREERDREIRPLEGQSVGRDDDYDAGGGGSGWGDAGGGSDGGGDDGGFDGGGFDGGGGDSGGGSDF
ncbi:MAG TPA: hypothetical protein VEK07_08225 [Polyangiaceae bacterium]|nr:hypothetical protein [Polyangiaceae bacterium]